jgi:hypothetical protein
MKALIAPHEEACTNLGTPLGLRIAEVSDTPFEVAQPLVWVDCPDECDANLWYFDENTQTCLVKPVEVVPPAEPDLPTP